MLDLGADVNIRSSDFHAKTPLHLASKVSCLDCAHVLLKSGAVVDMKDACGNTPLMKASAKGNLQVVELLILHGANINCINVSGSTALHIASSKGHIDVVRCLLERGSNKQLKNRSNETAEFCAFKRKHSETAQLITSFDYSSFQEINSIIEPDENANEQYTLPIRALKMQELKSIDQKLSGLAILKSEMKQVCAADEIQLRKAHEALKNSELRYMKSSEELKNLQEQINIATMERSSVKEEFAMLCENNVCANDDLFR